MNKEQKTNLKEVFKIVRPVKLSVKAKKGKVCFQAKLKEVDNKR